MMKKILIIITLACLSILTYGQSERVFNSNMKISKVAPRFTLSGLGATILMDGATSGTTTLRPYAVAGGTIVIPQSAGTDTLSTRAYARSVPDTTSLSTRIDLKADTVDQSFTGTIGLPTTTEYNGVRMDSVFVPFSGAVLDINIGTHSLTTTGTVETGKLGLGNSASPNYFVTDSLTTTGTTFKLFDGATQLAPDIPVGGYDELSNYAVMVDDTLHSNGQYFTQWQVDSLVNASLATSRLLADTTILHTFSVGNWLARDTGYFEAGAVLNAFYNGGGEEFNLVSVVSQISSGDTLSWHWLYADTINAVVPTHITDTIGMDGSITYRTATFENDEIPANVWVYAKAIGTTDKENPIFFSATLNGSRDKVTYNPIYDLLSDGHTKAWYMFDELGTITKDGSNLVSEWSDYLGSGRDLIQASGTNQPTWSATAITFDGSDNFMKTDTFAYDQPVMIYMVLNPVTFTNGDCIFDGYSATTEIDMLQVNPTPNVRLRSISSDINNATTATTGAYHIFRCLINGASSKLVVDNVTTTETGLTAGTMLGGFTLGSYYTGGSSSNIAVKEIILRDISDSAGTESLIFEYLNAKYGLGL